MDVKTVGPYALSERSEHISYQELLVALKALKCFTATLKDSAVDLRLDNTSKVSYINRLGGEGVQVQKSGLPTHLRLGRVGAPFSFLE